MTARHRALALVLALLAAPLAAQAPAAPPPALATLAGEWRLALDLAAAELHGRLEVLATEGGAEARLCHGAQCDPPYPLAIEGDSVRFEILDYAATVMVAVRGDSLVGWYRNVGNRGPRTIPVRASRGRWTPARAPAALAGRWDAWFQGATGSSPRVLEFRNGRAGIDGTVIGNTGDYGRFGGEMRGDTLTLSRFDGSFVYHLEARLEGDSLVGRFHAGPRTITPFVARRSTGRPHLADPNTLTRADTTAPFRFAFRDVDGRLVTQDDPQFRGKIVFVDIFGSWCPTCHDAAPTLVRLHKEFAARGVAFVGLAYEVSGDTATDASLVRRYRDRFGIPFPLLLAGRNDVTLAAATLPQLDGFTSFPTTLFLGRDGRVRRVHAGFHGPATGALHAAQVADFRATLELLLKGSP